MSARYTPYYCEENVWWLLDDGLTDGHAVFVINAYNSVALWSQRASDRPDGLTLWDYHVVALGKLEGEWHIFDPDCVAGTPLPAAQWIGATFPFAGAVPEDVEPVFRVVAAADFFERFHTDRSHMRGEDGWLAPPPDWPALSTSSNLTEFCDPQDKAIPGEVVDLDTLIERVR